MAGLINIAKIYGGMIINGETIKYNSTTGKPTKIPIKKGCPNQQCFCTGECQKIVGYRDKIAGEV